MREATLEDADHLIHFNYSMAKETEGKELSKELLTEGVKNLIKN